MTRNAVVFGRPEGATAVARAFADLRRSSRAIRLSATGVLLLGLAACTSAPAPPAGGATGPYLALQPDAFAGRIVGSGECVDFVKVVAGAPPTAAWREGVQVRGNPHIPPGTAIATFGSDGTYTNQSGNHAAIYLYQDHRGIWVYDQWQGQPVQKRLIRFEGGSGSDNGSKSNDGTTFAVIG